MADQAAAPRIARPKVIQPKPTNKTAPPPVALSAPPIAAPSISTTHANDSTPAAAAAAAPTSVATPRPLAPKIVSSAGSGSSILAHPQQKGNPLLKEITKQRWEHSDIAPDYHIAQSTCALFLQLKYHRLHPEYIHQRIKAISGMYSHRLLILQHDVDASSSEPAIRELTKIALVNNLTLLIAWSPTEAAHWLEKYKMVEFKGAELIRGRMKETQRERMSDVLTQPTGVNKTDATGLMTRYGSIREISQATADHLGGIPGMGEIKVKRLREAFTTPFRTDEQRSYRDRKAARLAERAKESGADPNDSDMNHLGNLEAQEALAAADHAGADDGPGGCVARSGDAGVGTNGSSGNGSAKPGRPPDDDDNDYDLSDDAFELNEEELAMLEQTTAANSFVAGYGSNRGEHRSPSQKSRHQTQSQAQAQRAILLRHKTTMEQGDELEGEEEGGRERGHDKDIDDCLVHFENFDRTGAATLPPREQLQPAERDLKRSRGSGGDGEANVRGDAEGEGGVEGEQTEEEIGLDGLTREEREELRLALQMSLAGAEEGE